MDCTSCRSERIELTACSSRRRARVVTALACLLWSIHAPGTPAPSLTTAPESRTHAAASAPAQGKVNAPATGAKPDTCTAASFAGGTLDVHALRLPTAPGTAVTVAFWMRWNGVDGAMPLSFASQGLWLAAGGFGFTTGNGDLYGISGDHVASTSGTPR